MAEIVSCIAYNRGEFVHAIHRATALQDLVALGVAILGREARWHVAVRQGTVKPGEDASDLDASIAAIPSYRYLRAVCGLPGDRIECWVDEWMGEDHCTALEEGVTMLSRVLPGQMHAGMPVWKLAAHHQGSAQCLPLSLRVEDGVTRIG